MSRVPTIALFLFAWMAVFAATQFGVVARTFGAPANVIPALMVYAALTHPMGVVAALALVGGLGFDSLSANPLGVSILPLFAVGFVLRLRQHLILRDQTYAQIWLGAAAGVLVPLGTLMLIRWTSARPIAGPWLLWQMIFGGVLNGLSCPVIFALFDTLRRTFDYQPIEPGSFRPDREIKRGRL